MTDKKCTHCPHDAHEGRKCTAKNPHSSGFLHNGLCNCDGKTQYFLVTGDSIEEVESKLALATRAGYEIEQLTLSPKIHQAAGGYGGRTDKWFAIVYSDLLPPVSSMKEFNQRVGL